MNQYRLLRSNKESGPYTAEQLIQLGLKSYDLVWADGKSAAWRYPCEMEEFKAHAPAVEEQPFDRFFKKSGGGKNTVAAVPGPPEQAVAFTTSSTPLVKPRIRVRADWNKVEQPAAEKIAQPAAKPVAQPQPHQAEKTAKMVVEPPKAQPQPQQKQAVNANTSWTSAWLDWQQEKKAVEHAAKTTDENEAANAHANKQAPELETKFSQSLNEIKQRYAETILKTKGKTAEWYKYKGLATIVLLAMPVLGFGIWLGSGWHAGSDATVPKPPVAIANAIPTSTAETSTVQQQQPYNNHAALAENTNDNKPLAKKPNTYSKEVIPSFDDEKAEGKPAQQLAKKPAPQAAAAQAHAQPAAVGAAKYAPVNQRQAALPQYKQPQPAQQRQYAFTAPSNAYPSARSKVVNPALVASSANNAAAYNNNLQKRQQENAAPEMASRKPDADAAPVFTHYSKKQKIEDFVSVDADLSSQQSIQNHLLNVENVTDAPIDLVVIDVQYYDTYGKFRTGQTIYVKNIPVNETITTKIPDNPNASRIKFKVSLVSVEQKGVYLVAE